MAREMTGGHRRRNGKDHGGHGPLTFRPKLFLKSFLSFLNTIFMRKTIHQDEESTKLRRNSYVVEGLVFARGEIEISMAPSLLVTFLRPCRGGG